MKPRMNLSMDKNHLRWMLQGLPKSAGLLGMVGIVLLGAALLLYYQKLRPFEKDLQNRQFELDEKERMLDQRVKEAKLPAEKNALRTEASFTAFMRESLSIAQKNHLGVTQSEYRTVSEVEGRLVRYSLQFPVAGTYPELREYVIEVSQIKGARIEALIFARSQISDPAVTGQIQLSYLTEVRK